MSLPDRAALLDSLRSSDPGRQVAALGALDSPCFALDDELIDAVGSLLGANNKQLSRRAAGILARAVLDDCEHAAAFLAVALTSPSVLERWGAAFALAGADILDRTVGEAALDALALDDGDIRWAAAGIVRAVAQRDCEFMRRLQAVAASSSGAQRKMSIYCLRDLGHRDSELYCAALDADDVGTRHAALSALQSVGEATADTVAAVVHRLAVEPDPGVRRSVAIVLGRIMGTHTEAAAALSRAAAASDDEDFKRAAELVLRDR